MVKMMFLEEIRKRLIFEHTHNKLGKCMKCDLEIFDGDDYYQICDGYLCRNCGEEQARIDKAIYDLEEKKFWREYEEKNTD